MLVRGTRTENPLPGFSFSQKLHRRTASLSLYSEPPNEEITVDEFELYALDRLQLLRGLEQIRSRDGGASEGMLDDKKLKEKLRNLEAKHVPLRQTAELFHSDLRKDVISHFILRLAYSQTEDLRRWFITQECNLLKYR